jgi:hypothetical protein
LAVAGLVIELALWNEAPIAAKVLRYYWFRLADFAAPMAVALQVTSLIATGLEERRAWRLPALVVALAFAVWFLWSTSWARLQNPISPADNRVASYKNWLEVCEWVVTNTPPDALFITPRLNCTFKWRAERPEVVNRKDVPQDAAGIVEWDRRLKDIYFTEFAGEELRLDSVGALGTQRVKELAGKYHAQYVLSDRAQLVELPVAFQNNEYVVYRIENRSASDRR